jgi:hypothetical protein
MKFVTGLLFAVVVEAPINLSAMEAIGNKFLIIFAASGKAGFYPDSSKIH